MKKELTIPFLLMALLLHSRAYSQKIVNPVVHSKSHPSLTIDSLVLGEKQTHCYLQVENLSTEGNAWFCADEDIRLTELNGNRIHRLIRAEGIPTCPEKHPFMRTGERLQFTLVFSGIVDTKSEIDIIENCADNCFSLKGIVLDPLLNAEIRQFERGVMLFNQKDLSGARPIFESLIHSGYTEENHFAFSLYILPVIYFMMEEEDLARAAYDRLKSSSVREKTYFLEKLHEMEYFRKWN